MTDEELVDEYLKPHNRKAGQAFRSILIDLALAFDDLPPSTKPDVRDDSLNRISYMVANLEALADRPELFQRGARTRQKPQPVDTARAGRLKRIEEELLRRRAMMA